MTEQKDEVMDDLTDQVKSLFYNDVHINAVNMRMHTSIKCETPDGRTSRLAKHLKLILGLMESNDHKYV